MNRIRQQLLSVENRTAALQAEQSARDSWEEFVADARRVVDPVRMAHLLLAAATVWSERWPAAVRLLVAKNEVVDRLTDQELDKWLDLLQGRLEEATP